MTPFLWHTLNISRSSLSLFRSFDILGVNSLLLIGVLPKLFSEWIEHGISLSWAHIVYLIDIYSRVLYCILLSYHTN